MWPRTNVEVSTLRGGRARVRVTVGAYVSVTKALCFRRFRVNRSLRSNARLRVISLVGAATILIAGAACNGVLGNEAIIYDVEAGAPDAAPDSVDAPVDTSIVAVDAACEGEAACERIVFVTSTTFLGALMGLDGADALCQQIADRSGSSVRGRKFLAWLSVVQMRAGDRLVHGTKAYKRTDGHVVAANWNELTKGNLLEPIDRDEKGMQRSPVVPVWTGTLLGGGLHLPSCDDWTTGTAAASGTRGTTLAKDLTWTEGAEADCSMPAALYCFER